MVGPEVFTVSSLCGKAVFSLPIGQGMNFAVGDFVGVIIDFLIVACVVFFIAKYAGKIGLK